jgi:hypothetical protein
MKIKKEHYEHMKSAMVDKLAGTPALDVTAYLRNLENDPRVKDVDKRFRWDLFHAAGLTKYACDTLYVYLDDAHIDSALKAIMKEMSK